MPKGRICRVFFAALLTATITVSSSGPLALGDSLPLADLSEDGIPENPIRDSSLPDPLESPSTGKIKAHHLADGEEKTPPPDKEVYPALESDPLPKKPNQSTLPHLNAFDSVPLPQREPVIRRLYLTEKLIREYGRAYDYRSITYSELLSILNQLRKKESATKKKRPE